MQATTPTTSAPKNLADIEIPTSVHFLIAFLTGMFGGDSVIAREAVANTIERLAAKLRAELISEGQPMSMAILAERVGVKLVRIGALPPVYLDSTGDPIGPHQWVSVVDGKPLAVVAHEGEGEGADFFREYLAEYGLAEAIGVELLTRCGIPLERAVRRDLCEVGRRLVGAMMIPREEVERLFPEDFRASCVEDDAVNERALELAERYGVMHDFASDRVCYLLDDVRPSWCGHEPSAEDRQTIDAIKAVLYVRDHRAEVDRVVAELRERGEGEGIDDDVLVARAMGIVLANRDAATVGGAS